jgi:hypothetical protein
MRNDIKLPMPEERAAHAVAPARAVIPQTRRRPKLWLWLPGLLVWFAVSPAGAQLLTNGGFESGLSGWNSSLLSGGVATFANSTGDIHTGTNALLVTVSNPGTASNSVQITSSPFTASSSDTYVLRFWASASVDFAKLGINFNGAVPAYPQIPFQISTNANSYQEYLYAFRASGTVTVAFDFQTAANYWLDDVEVLDLTNNDGWDIPMTYLWQWGQLNYSKTNSVGWGGGDNDKSAQLPDGSVAWIFNDTWTMTLTNTFYSNIHGGGSLPRNSLVHQVGTNLYWMNNGTATFFVPTNPANLYWIGDSVVESNKLLVLLNEINAAAITNTGMAVATLSLPELTLDSISEVPSPGTDNYGSFVNGGDGYYYIYDGPKVARAPVGDLAVSSAWTYWNGSAWVTNHAQAVGLPNLVNPWSTIRLGPGNYATVFMPALSVTIMAQFAPTPMGPWGIPVPVYQAQGQWGELYYAPNICAGTGSNGVYTIAYSDDGSPDNLAKVAADKSYYNPHFITANLWQLSPYSVSNGAGGPGSRLSLKFAADKNWGYNAIDNRWGAGVLNTTNWVNIYGINGGSSGVTNLLFYAANGAKYASGARLVYNWANEVNYINNNAPMSNNLALMDGYINVGNNTWYLSVTNLDPPFTNGYRLYFYFNGGATGRGGENCVIYHAGQTTNTAVLGMAQWSLYTTATNNDGHFTQGLTPSNPGATGETPGANYIVFTNLSGGAFDLLITNGNYGGVNAIEIVANPAVTAGSLSASTNNAAYGSLVVFTNLVTPAPPNGENVVFLDGAAILGATALQNGLATCGSTALLPGNHFITAIYAGDANYLASTSSILSQTVAAIPTLGTPVALPSASAFVGTTVTLVCSNYSGTPPYAFQWQAGGGVSYTNLNGATTNALVLPNVTAGNAGYYQLAFTADGLAVTSPAVQLTVDALPVISIQPAGGSLVLQWPAGTLLQATNVTGPWITNNATSPCTNPAIYPQLFYRVQVQ